MAFQFLYITRNQERENLCDWNIKRFHRLQVIKSLSQLLLCRCYHIINSTYSFSLCQWYMDMFCTVNALVWSQHCVLLIHPLNNLLSHGSNMRFEKFHQINHQVVSSTLQAAISKMWNHLQCHTLYQQILQNPLWSSKEEHASGGNF